MHWLAVDFSWDSSGFPHAQIHKQKDRTGVKVQALWSEADVSPSSTEFQTLIIQKEQHNLNGERNRYPDLMQKHSWMFQISWRPGED